jgi:predicted RNase H-like nuclease (RuvC/YqgF family)
VGNHGIREEQVFEAADRIKEKGGSPTLQLIREELGTGSFATISKFLSQWKMVRATKQEIPNIPPEFNNYIKKFWAFCYKEAAANLETEKEAFRTERANLSEERNDLLKIIERLEEESSFSLTEKMRIEKKLEAANQQINQLNEDLATKKAQLAATEIRRLESTERADRIEQQLANLLKDHLKNK